MSLKLSGELPGLVSQFSALLVKGFSGLEEVHHFLRGMAVFPVAGETWAHLKKYPNTVEVTNIVNQESGRPGWFSANELGWHSNGVYQKNPETCVALYCDLPGDSGGETELINMRSVYQDLPEDFQNQIESYEIEYSRDLKKIGKGFYDYTPFEIQEFKKHSKRYFPGATADTFSDIVTKKLVVKHPVDGALGLYFPFSMANKIMGVSDEASREIGNTIHTLAMNPKYLISNQWQAGDLLFMDQIHAVHRRRRYSGDRRLFRMSFWWSSPSPLCLSQNPSV